jgi:hypothetical protein
MTTADVERYLLELDALELRVARQERRFPGDAEVLDLQREVRIRRVAALEYLEAARAGSSATVH